MTYRPGDVVLVNFPFTDITSSKLRPAVVITDKGADVIILGVFSKIPEAVDESHFLIEDTAAYFSNTGLKKTSVVKTDKIAVVHRSNIRRPLGSLPDDIFDIVKTKLKKSLGLS